MWFLNCRAEPVGGDTSPVRITDGTLTYLTYPQFLADIRGHHVLLGIHGFNVHQAGAVDHMQEWSKLLTLDPLAVFVGVLWPGDSSWLAAMEYPFATKAATRSGDAIAEFITTSMSEALSVSFVTHSLGARVALKSIQGLSSTASVPRLIMMAPAIDDNCLTGEFAIAAKRVVEISILASDCDKVLKLAFPLGNPLSGIFSVGHPYWHAALGRSGPSKYPTPNNIEAGWLLPNSWTVDHGDYLPPAGPYPAGYSPEPYTILLDFPDPASIAPAAGTPTVFDIKGKYLYWQSAWTAALTSWRFR